MDRGPARARPPPLHRRSTVTEETAIADRAARHRRIVQRRRTTAAAAATVVGVAVLTVAGVGLARPSSDEPAAGGPASTSPANAATAPPASGPTATTTTTTTTAAPAAETTGPLSASAAEDVRRRLTATLDPLVEPYDMGVSIVDHRSGATWSYRGTKPNILASLTKLTTAVGLFLRAADEGREVTDGERDLMRRALQVSDNDAQNAVWERIGGHEGFDRTAARLHLSDTVSDHEHAWGRSRSTAEDQTHLMEMLLGATPPIDADDAAWILRTMRGVSPEQRWGSAPFGGAEGRTLEVKNGWSPYADTNRWRLTSLGHVADADHDYTIAILSDGWTSFEEGTPRLDAVGRAVYDTLATR